MASNKLNDHPNKVIKMANSEKPKCFSTILRRFMCIGSLQTHPSENLFIEHSTKNLKHNEEDSKPISNPTSTPGIVARLMGLDSLPDHIINLSSKERSFGSYLRSKSVNSLDLSQKLKHRRVKTSVSFRENGDELLVVRFEEDYKSNERKDLQEKPVKRVVQSLNSGEKFVAKRSLKRCDITKAENVKVRRRLKNRRSNIKRSLLPEQEMVRWQEKNTSSCPQQSRLHTKVTKPAGTISPENPPQKLKEFEGLISNNNKGPSAITRNLEKQKKNFEAVNYYEKLVNGIRRLSEEDIKGTSWVAHDYQVMVYEDLEEICVLFEQQIFTSLLNQIVRELVVNTNLKK